MTQTLLYAIQQAIPIIIILLMLVYILVCGWDSKRYSFKLTMAWVAGATLIILLNVAVMMRVTPYDGFILAVRFISLLVQAAMLGQRVWMMNRA